MIRSDNHASNLYQFYIDKGLGSRDAYFYTSEKLKKLDVSENPFSYRSWLQKLMPFLEGEIGKASDDLLIVDFGCGSGEIVILLRHLGFKAIGYDVYAAEIDLARKLAKENGYTDDLFFSSKEQLFEYIGVKKINVLASFSVLEHLSDNCLLEKLDDFSPHLDGCVFALVPSKYKIVDDHTGMKFLGLVPRNIARTIVGLSRHKYKLSENGDWDVWYRSFATLEKLSASRGFVPKLVHDDVIYPRLNEVAKIGQTSRATFGARLERVYGWLLRLVTRNEINLYPYLNVIFKKSR